MKNFIKWNVPAGRTVFILTALATILAIHLFPAYFINFLKTSIRGADLGAVRLVINALVTPLFFFLISIPLVVVTRRRLIDLHLTAALAFAFPIWALFIIINAPVLSLIAFPLSSQHLLMLNPGFWISIIPFLFMAAVPGRTSGGPPQQYIYQKFQQLTETRSRINAKDYRKKTIQLLCLAPVIPILSGLIAKAAGTAIIAHFVMIVAGIAVLMVIMMITIYTIRRLNDLDRSYLWAGFIPLYLQNIINIISILTLSAIGATGITSSVVRILLGLNDTIRYYNIATMAACIIVLAWLMIEKTFEHTPAAEDDRADKAPYIDAISPAFSPAKAILGVIVAVLSITALYKYLHPYDYIRYRMTVSIQTPEGIKTGTAVRQANFEQGPDSKASWSIGDAVAIDLGERGKVFALIDNNNIGYGVSSQTLCAHSNFGSSKARVGSKWILSEESYPKFVVFTDVNNPKTMKTLWDVTNDNSCPQANIKRKPVVINDNVEELLGKRVKIQQVSLEITKDSVTDKIQKILPWLYCRASSKGVEGLTLHKSPTETNVFHRPARGDYKKILKAPEATECEEFREIWASYDRKKFQDELAYWKQYATQGAAIAQYETGKLLAKGDGHDVAPDRAESLKWYRLAADQGYQDAQAKLAVAYGGQNGDWKKAEDVKQAYFWALLATLATGAREIEHYAVIVNTAPKYMTPEEKDYIEERVRAWRPSAASTVVEDISALSKNLLSYAKRSGNNLIPQLMIERGADINGKNEKGQTVLMLAADAGNLGLVQFLIGHGADINALNHQGQTALFMAARNGNPDITATLLKAGIQSRLRDGSGETADKIAERNRHTEAAVLIQQAMKASTPSPDMASGSPATRRPAASPTESQIRRVQANTEVHYIGVYEATGPATVEIDNPPAKGRASRRPTSRSQAGKIEVAITRRTPAPIILVLTSYEPVKWVLSPAYGVNISGIIVSGYHKQSVEGAPPNVPILNTSYEQSETPNVEYLFGYDSSSPEFPMLMKRIEDLTGVPQHNIFFTGVYKESGFEIK